MNFIRRKLFIALAFLTLSSSIAFAHGIHFHSIAELENHISQHIQELEQLTQQTTPNAAVIKEECDEIRVHAEQYRQFAAELKNQNPKLAKTLDAKSLELKTAASHQDLFESIRILKEMALAF